MTGVQTCALPIYLHGWKRASSCTVSPVAWLIFLEAVVTSSRLLQHFDSGVEQLRRIRHLLPLHWVPDPFNRLIGHPGLVALLALLHKTFSTSLPYHPWFLTNWQNGFASTISLQSVMLADNFVHTQTFVRVVLFGTVVMYFLIVRRPNFERMSP